MKEWQKRRWLDNECCGIEGAVEVFTEVTAEDDVEDGNQARCSVHGCSGRVVEYCGDWGVQWVEE